MTPRSAIERPGVLAWRHCPTVNSTRLDSILSDDQVRAVVAACYGHCPRLGLFIETLAVFGCRPIQAARLVVGDLQADRILMPSSAKGRGRKRIDRRPLPLPAALAAKLRIAAGDRIPEAPLLLRADGVTVAREYEQALSQSHEGGRLVASDRAVRVAAFLDRAQPVAGASDPAGGRRAQHFGRGAGAEPIQKFIADHSDAALRTAQIDMAPMASDPVVVSLRRP